MGGGSGSPRKKGTFRVVHHDTVGPEKLQRVAEILGIPKAQRGQLWSVEFHMKPAQPKKSAKKSKKSGA
jgi:hypothetical protein